jgi:hypothetical protein
MSAPEATKSKASPYGTAQDWATIISAAGQGAGTAMQGNAANISSKEEAKEAKRRTFANLLNQALKRKQGLFRVGQEHSDEMNDFQSQAIQQVARGFVNALQGSTG